MTESNIIIARKICTDYLGCSRAMLSLLMKDDAFPPPSYTAPGAKGKMVWFVRVVDVWRAEWLALRAEGHSSRDAGRQATVTAAVIDQEIKNEIATYQHAGNVLHREGSDNGGHPIKMVAG